MRRLRREDGFTLPELLVVLFVSAIVLAGAATGVQAVMRQSTGTILRTDATQRGRLALDQVTQQLRSQVCIDVGTPSQKVSMVAATKNSVSFYADLNDGSKPPSRRELKFDAAAKTLTETTWAPTSAVGVTPTTFAATGKKRVLLQSVTAYNDGGATPFFRYYGYQPTGSPRLDTLQFDPGAGTLTTTQLEDTARITIAMEVLPARAPDKKISTRLEDSVHLRTSDPNKNNPDPECRA